jgi:hypothetical protein
MKVMMRALFCLFLLITPTLGAAELISKSVGQVGNPAFAGKSGAAVHYVSSRETQLHYMVRYAAQFREVENRKGLVPDNLLATHNSFAPEVVETLKDWMVFLETETFNVSEVSSEERERLRSNVQDLIGRTPFYRNLEFSDREIRDCVLRFLKAQAFVQFKRKGVPPATDAEAQKYFHDNRIKFGNGAFADFKDNIKLALNRQEVERRLQEWYQALIRKHNVRSYLQDL